VYHGRNAGFWRKNVQFGRLIDRRREVAITYTCTGCGVHRQFGLEEEVEEIPNPLTP
jgi:hypothetical protein